MTNFKNYLKVLIIIFVLHLLGCKFSDSCSSGSSRYRISLSKELGHDIKFDDSRYYACDSIIWINDRKLRLLSNKTGQSLEIIIPEDVIVQITSQY